MKMISNVGLIAAMMLVICAGRSGRHQFAHKTVTGLVRLDLSENVSIHVADIVALEKGLTRNDLAMLASFDSLACCQN